MNNNQKLIKCKEILHKYCCYQKITSIDDIQFLLDIFQNHPEWESKKGVGIDYITTELTMYKSKCFHLHRLDDSSTDISYIHSIKNRTPIIQVNKACRHSIKNIIINFKNNNVTFGVTKCPFTNEVLRSDNTHIDHYNLPFVDVFNKWILNKDINYLFKFINETEDNSLETYFTDENIINDFVSFHNSNTHLRAVSKKANLTFLKQ